MRGVCIMLLLLLAKGAIAQKIHFTDTSNHWLVQGSYFDGTTAYTDYYDYGYNGDSIISGVRYRVIQIQGGTSLYFVREDTLQGKVYGFSAPSLNSVCNDTAESVLYDYRLLPGDTVVHGQYKFYVSSLDSVQIQNTSHKVWHMLRVGTSWTSTAAYDVIEGIGSLCTPVFPSCPFTFENAFRMYCFSNANGHPSVSPAVNSFFDNGNSCTLGIASLAGATDAKVIPNPGGREQVLKLPRPMTGTVSVYNINGKTVRTFSFTGLQQIPLGSWLSVPGCYCYRFTATDSDFKCSGTAIFRN